MLRARDLRGCTAWGMRSVISRSSSFSYENLLFDTAEGERARESLTFKLVPFWLISLHEILFRSTARVEPETCVDIPHGACVQLFLGILRFRVG